MDNRGSRDSQLDALFANVGAVLRLSLAVGVCVAGWMAQTGRTSMLMHALGLPDAGERLAQAAALGDTDQVREAIMRGISPIGAALMTDGHTPLMFAAQQGNLEMVRLLLESGSDPNEVIGRSTALKLAEAGRHDEVVEALRRAGANDE